MSESLLSPSICMFESSMGALANNFKMTFGLKGINLPPPEPQGNSMSESTGKFKFSFYSFNDSLSKQYAQSYDG